MFQLFQFPYLFCLWTWRLNIMKFHRDLVVIDIKQVRLFLDQAQKWG